MDVTEAGLAWIPGFSQPGGGSEAHIGDKNWIVHFP